MDPATMAAIAGGGKLVSAGIGAVGDYYANKARAREAREIARKQEEALRQARGEYGEAYTDISSLYNPYVEGGQQAFEQYQDRDFSYAPGEFEYSQTIGDFLDPSMDFQMEQAMRPIESSAAAGGSLGSGATLKALQDRGQQVANMNYGQAFDRMNQDKSFTYNQYLNNATMKRQQLKDQENQLLNIANTGYNATQNVAGARDALGTRNAGAYMQAGNIPSSAAIGHGLTAQNISTFTDPAFTGAVFGAGSQMAGGMGGQQPQMQMQTQQTPYTGMGSTSYQPASPTDWFNPRGGNL